MPTVGTHPPATGAIRAVKRAFNWAVQQGLIANSPIGTLKKPRALCREVLVPPEQWKQVLAAADESLRDILTILRETGCRPEEARIVQAQHLHGDHFILSKKDSKGEVHNRIVWLTAAAQTILSRLAQEHPTGPLLRNRKGKPWTGGALSGACNRLAKDVGFRFFAYATRHTWITTALENEVDAVSVALLAGHRDPSMVAKVYSHLAGNADHMRKSLQKATGAGGTGPAS